MNLYCIEYHINLVTLLLSNICYNKAGELVTTLDYLISLEKLEMINFPNMMAFVTIGGELSNLRFILF